MPQTKNIFKDDGKGMKYEELKNKWLFVAYSAKIDGTEDISKDKKTDYRDKIRFNRIFAGAKGVGRFSCDRLGRKLNLITIKDETGRAEVNEGKGPVAIVMEPTFIFQ